MENISVSGNLVLECTATKYTRERSEIQSGLVTGHGPGSSMCYQFNTSWKSSL